MLDDAGVATGRACRERVALPQPHRRAGLGRERRERATGDAAADDRHVDGGGHPRRLSPPSLSCPRMAPTAQQWLADYAAALGIPPPSDDELDTILALAGV